MDNCDRNDHITDVKLWNLLKSGDRQALKILFERYYTALYHYAYKVSGDKSLAEDCIQELFYTVWDRRQHLADISSVKAYLWVSLRRDIFKAIKKERKAVKGEDLFLQYEMLAFTKEEVLIHQERKKEQKKALLQALNTLPDRHKEAVILKFFNGMGYNEIQKIMAVSYQTARNYVYHGVKSLKNELEDRTFVSTRKAAM